MLWAGPVGTYSKGGLAQLARASALHAEGQRFESVILHHRKEDDDIMEAGGFPLGSRTYRGLGGYVCRG